MLSHSGLNLHKSMPTGPRWALIAPKWGLVGLIVQTDWIEVKTVFILKVIKTHRTSKSNTLSFDHNHLIKNSILICKFLSPLKLHRNGVVFKIYVWISVFRRKKTIWKSDTWLPRYLLNKHWTIFFKHPVAFMVCEQWSKQFSMHLLFL